MEPELWAELSAAISAVQRRVKYNPRDTHPTALVVRVHLWAALHDRPTSWACDPRHWTDRTRPAALPDQSTMSRRTRRKDFEPFLTLLGRRLNGGGGATALVRIVDGKPLELPNHTTDRDASWGRGVSRTSVGYKLHAVWRPGAAMPDALAITPLDACEKQMAYRMAKRLGGGGGEGGDLGYLLGDAHYDASWLFDACRYYGLRLVCPRPKPGAGLGHRYQSPERLRAIDLLEVPGGLNGFGPSLYRLRPGIEREFAGAVTFGGGLTTLPAWVRRIWRVRNWVWAKLLVNAARVRRNKRTCAA